MSVPRPTQAAAQAQIDQFIESRPDAYESFVGEQGIRLSGGQCQRIGIARALYKRASLLVFDEATSLPNSGLAAQLVSYQVLIKIYQHQFLHSLVFAFLFH